MERYDRARLLLGDEAILRLRGAAAAVFGLGGVGSYAAEALARGGVGTLHLFDHDRVAKSNMNRQLYALESTIGFLKTDVAQARIRDIDPEIRVFSHSVFFSAETVCEADFSAYDYVIDAIDTVSSKLLIAECCRAAGTPSICCLGTGNKLDPSRLRVADIFETSVCPLARVMRRELRRRGFSSYRVLFSDEPPIAPRGESGEIGAFEGRQTPGSVSFVPPVAGMMLAGEAIRQIAGV